MKVIMNDRKKQRGEFDRPNQLLYTVLKSELCVTLSQDKEGRATEWGSADGNLD